MLYWDVDRDDLITIIDLKIMEYTFEDRQKGLGHHQFRNYLFNIGNCLCYWSELSIPDLTCKLLRILFDYKYKEKDLKKILIEFGKIEELECIRKMCYQKFYDDDFTFDEWKEHYYG